jgi:hypothetical protein
MEQQERPDLFDIKFLRDELLYYSRDENQFLRRRQNYVFALYPDLAQARFKDANLPWQRGILVLASLLAVVRKLADWLNHDALTFEFLVLDPKRLADEADLLRTLFREQIASKQVSVEIAEPGSVALRCQLRARRCLCKCLALSLTRQEIAAEGVSIAQWILNGPVPALALDTAEAVVPESDSPLEGWRTLLLRLLQAWID